jgi:hypothetical protein
MNKDEKTIRSQFVDGEFEEFMSDLSISIEPSITKSMQQQAIAFAEWIGEECIYADSGFYIHISTLRQYKLPELYTLFNTNNTNNGE